MNNKSGKKQRRQVRKVFSENEEKFYNKFQNTILNFKLESGRSRSVMIFSDAINTEQFRQLRVRLKVSSGKLFKKDNKRMLN